MATEINWQKSTFSGGGDGDDCVEVAATPTTIRLRESDSPAHELTTMPAPLTHLLQAIRTGALHPRP